MNAEQLDKTLRFMLDCEARRGKDGRIKIYPLPKGDGGGTYEVAGINDRYNPADVLKLRDMIHANASDEEVAKVIMEVYDQDTKVAARWTNCAAIEAWLRDAVFNRGSGGAAKMLQMALHVVVDGDVGPKTKAALDRTLAFDVEFLLSELRFAAERYERNVAPPVGARAKFWDGLVNRWDKRTEFARSLI